MAKSNSKDNVSIQLILNILFACAIAYLLLQQIMFKAKTAYIDSNKIYSNYKGILIAKKEFQKRVELYKERMDTLTGRVKLDMLNMEKFNTNKVEYQHYLDSAKYHKRQIHDYESAMNQSLKEEEAKLTKTSIEKLNQFLKDYGKEKGYDIIFIANNTGTIAYAKDNYDITDEVLKEINKQYE